MSEVRSCDVAVLGAGMVGISAALHLLKRGRSVVLIDRRGPAEETSYGNAGILQSEGVVPYAFPREIGRIVRAGLNMTSEAHVHWRALPVIAGPMRAYWRNSAPERLARSARAFAPLAARCIAEHEVLMTEAGTSALLRRTGYLKLYRDPAALAKDAADEEAIKRTYGVNYEVIDSEGIGALEPHITGAFSGGILMPDPVSVSDPGRLGQSYAALFERLGGHFARGDAMTLEATDNGYRIAIESGTLAAREAIVALGPWSGDLMQRLGYALPLFVKRGYHMHYRPVAGSNATLSRPVIDTDGGYVLAPMSKGIRLTTGAEFALRDAPPSPVQLAKVEPLARRVFPLGERVEPEPWMGRRPCLPDMLPVIGQAPRHRGLWCDFAHQHWGFTLGPVSGRLLGEMMTGETPFTDPAPYRLDRF
ncbi:MAG: FAD-dependent oxidoreductase [Hyphomicrobiaceae bacterium]